MDAIYMIFKTVLENELTKLGKPANTDNTVAGINYQLWRSLTTDELKKMVVDDLKNAQKKYKELQSGVQFRLSNTLIHKIQASKSAAKIFNLLTIQLFNFDENE
jgi:predicted alpha/beta-fold hydrolase